MTSKLKIYIAWFLLSFTSALAQAPATISAADCASKYLRIHDQAFQIEQLDTTANPFQYSHLADAMRDAAGLVLAEDAPFDRLCSVDQVAKLDSLAAKLQPILASLQSAERSKRAAQILAALAAALDLPIAFQRR